MNKQKQQQIERQIDAIEKNFGKLSVERLKFWKIVRRFECSVNRAAERCCNGELTNEMLDHIVGVAVVKLLRCFENPGRLAHVLHVNTDPRGYAFKVEFKGVKRSGLCTDFGGFGIIAPKY